MNDSNVLTIITIKIMSRPISIVVGMNDLNVSTIVTIKIMSRPVLIVVDMNIPTIVTIKIITCVLIHRVLSTRVVNFGTRGEASRMRLSAPL